MKLLTNFPEVRKSKIIRDLVDKGRKLSWYSSKTVIIHVWITDPVDYKGLPILAD